MAELHFQKSNNLDLLRLFFAFQVMLIHTASHMSLPVPNFLSYLPGVPAFFFVSGFLIYASYINTHGRNYIYNRFLRLFPALFLVVTAGVGIVLLSKGIDFFLENQNLMFRWVFAQLTLGQAYNPELFRDIGVGVINGSLWTITVEILFYALVPVIVYIEKKFKNVVLFLVLVSLVVYSFGPHVFNSIIYKDKTVYDFLTLTPLVWGWMFGIGILSFKYFHHISRFLPYFYLSIFPLALIIFLDEPHANRLNLFYFIFYFVLILYVAFHFRAISLKVDLSYGIYIWHMPVINLFLVLGIQDAYLVIPLTLLIALVSWFLVERPALNLKHKSIQQ